MQFLSEESKNYLALLFPLMLFYWIKASILHIVILSLFLLLISTGNIFENFRHQLSKLLQYGSGPCHFANFTSSEYRLGIIDYKKVKNI